MATTIVETQPQPASLTLQDFEERPVAPKLDDRFAALKQEIIRDVDPTVLKQSYERLKTELANEVERLARLQQAAIPEVQWADIKANGQSRISFLSGLLLTMFDRRQDPRQHRRRG